MNAHVRLSDLRQFPTPGDLVVIGAALERGQPTEEIAEELGISKARLRVFFREVGLKDGPTRGRRSMSRFKAPVGGNGAMVLAEDHEAVVEARTLFRGGDLRDPATSDRPVLISGANNSKLGDRVILGPWAGMPIYHLSLEERATCPRSCDQWRSCYGNRMHRAARHIHGPALEAAIRRDVAILLARNPDGIVIRLHTLGDFYSLDYVRMWAELFTEHRRLHAFGYTHREQCTDDGIGDALAWMNAEFPARFVMRFSGMWGPLGSRVVAHAPDAPDGADWFLCKQEWAGLNGSREINCGSCGACWQDPERAVVFVEH